MPRRKKPRRSAADSQCISALVLAAGPDPLSEAVATYWATLSDLEEIASLRVLRTHVPQLKEALPETFDDEAVMAAIERAREGSGDALPPLDVAEYEAFISAPIEKISEQPSHSDRFFVRRMQPLADGLPAGIASVVVAPKLREVRVQFGFTRLEGAIPSPDGSYNSDAKIAPLTLDPRWLPAIEIAGEGLFLRFDSKGLAEWEQLPSVRERNDQLLIGFHRWASNRRGAVVFRGVRYYMLHTLSHLLMTAIALECGYAASAIRERIYCRESEPDMAGILLSTGTPGAEGTLGGLVEQAPYLRYHLRRAFELGTLWRSRVRPAPTRHRARRAQYRGRLFCLDARKSDDRRWSTLYFRQC